MDFTRRTVLQAGTGALLVVPSGCLTAGHGTPDATGTSPSPRRTAGETTATAADDPVTLSPGESYGSDEAFSVTVEPIAVQVAIVASGTVHDDPLYVDESQFVVADVVVAGDGAPDPADLDLFVRTDTLDRSDRYYVAAETNEARVRQRFGFSVPVSPGPRAGAIHWHPDGTQIRWELSSTVLSSIARPPRFELRQFEATDVTGDEIEVSLTVENGGEGDGRFLAEVGDAALSDQPEVAVHVPAGETVSTTRRVRADFDEREEMTVVLRWHDRRIERTIRRS